MRLTLRTLLAHLDDILDESDASELQKKIDESEMATQLVHRIRQIVGQTRLDSPALEPDGAGADANSVSEYLDNTLPAEEVPEFERFCLDSDVQLGEVAACHQILTIVLGEPAEITPRLKNRIYKLNHEPLSETVDSVIQSGTVGISTSEGDAETDDDDNISPVAEIQPIAGTTYDSDEHWTSAPDYLKKRKRGIWKPVGIAALIAFCLAFAGLRGMGPLNQSHPIAMWMRGEQVAELPSDEPDLPEITIPDETGTTVEDSNSTAEIRESNQDADPIQPQPPAELPPAELPPNSSDTVQANIGPPKTDNRVVESPEVEVQALAAPIDSPIETAAESLTFDPPANLDEPELPTDASDTIADNETAGIEAVTPASIPTNRTADAERRLNSPGISPPANVISDAANPDLPTDDLPTLAPPEPMDLGIIDLGPNVDDVAVSLPTDSVSDEADDGPTSTAGDEPREVGKFLSEDQLLARFNPLSDLWDRVPARDSIREEDDLLSFPIFRPQLMLSTGMQLTMVGPSRMRLLELSSDDSPSVRIEFGRATIETFSQVGSKMEFHWASQTAIASLADMNSSFAIEVSRQFVPGSDIERDEAHTIVHVYTKSGSVDWQINGNEPVTVAAGQRLTIVDDNPCRIGDVEEFPAWIDGSDARPRDPEAIRSLLPQVTVDRPISLSLKEQADSRRLEVRSLAVCSLAFLGEFDPLLVAMNDNRMKAYWKDEYKALTQAMVVNLESSQRVQQALQAKHGDEGSDLFRLLAGFDSAQLSGGGAQKLVNYLDHPSSDFRIVAHENLKNITGIPSLYMPHYAEKPRKKHVFSWKEKLNKGQIVYREPPAISVLLDGQSDDE